MKRTAAAMVGTALLATASACGVAEASERPYSFENFKCVESSWVRDDGKSLVTDLAAETNAPLTRFECVKLVTQMPDRVAEQMNQTNSLQGRQEAEWDVRVSDIPEAMVKEKPMADAHLSASWTYHPDDGLDVIITVEQNN